MDKSEPNEQIKDSNALAERPRFYNPLLTTIIVVFVYFFSQIMGVLLIGYGGLIFGKDIEQSIDFISSSTYVQVLYFVFVELITLYIIWWFLRIKKRGLKYIGLGRGPKWSDVLPALGVFAVYFVVLIIVSAIVKNAVPAVDTEQQQQIGFESANTFPELFLVFSALVVLVPITEEILVRGFLYSGLREKLSKYGAAILASVIFGVAHLELLGSDAPPLWIAGIDTAILSLFLIYLREKTGSLWSGIFVHALKNGIAFFVLFVVTAVSI